MTTKELISRRFEELYHAGMLLESPQEHNGFERFDVSSWNEWTTNAEHLLRSSFGEDSVHCQRFMEAINAQTSTGFKMERCKGIFAAARSDFQGGFTFQIERSIAGEIFADFNEAAKEALANGYNDVAVVLACAALEDTLKRLARLHGLAVDEKEMATVINALKSAGVIAGPEKKIFDTLPPIRNDALHGRWDKVSDVQIRTVVGVVESLLMKHF
jgi:hypothetical protein